MRRAELIFGFNLASFIVMLVMNILANALPINGLTTGEVSGLYPGLLVPAGFTFSIWLVIYSLLGLSLYYHYRVIRNRDEKRLKQLQATGWLFFASCLLNASWIVAWHYLLPGVSLLILIALLGTLIINYLNLKIGLKKVSAATRFMYHLPVSVYLGWISIAVVANFSAYFVSQGWNRVIIPDNLWAMLIIILLMNLSAVVTMTRRDIFFSLVVIWACSGIIVARLSDFQVPDTSFFVVTGACILILGMLVLYQLIRRRIY